MGLSASALHDLTYQVNGLAMEVQRELQQGHRERVYQYRLAELARAKGLAVEVEKRVEVFVNDSLIGYMYIDLWIEQSLIVECKAYQHQLTNDDVGQALTFLAATGSQTGLIFNFGRVKLEFKRVLPPQSTFEWHKHLYKSVWSPKGVTPPPISSIQSDSAIRFSLSNQPGNVISISPIAPAIAAQFSEEESSYAASGVSIDAGNRAVELMRDAVRATYGPQVLAGIGAFGGLFSAAELKGMTEPVLVASTDGVGTKVKLASQAGRYEEIGYDIVNHCINDILVQGAKPLFFLDYIASSKLYPDRVAAVVKGMASACRESSCALLGGETAEMPGVYQPNEFDVAGTVVGVVERASILPRPDLEAGDVLIGLRAHSPHTNGYSLIRKIFEQVALETEFPELGSSLADALLVPHRPYLPILQAELSQPQSRIKALAHITGGGFIENIPRVLPKTLNASITLGSWPVLPIFRLIQQQGEVDPEEMYRVFNMGIGMVVMVASKDAASLQAALPEETYIIGQLIPGEGNVVLQ